MDRRNEKRVRRSYRWPKQARESLTEFLSARDGGDEERRRRLRQLITRLVEITGYPRHACSRFVRQRQVIASSEGKPWTGEEKQKLLDLISLNSVQETATLMRRSSDSIRTMLHRLGASAQMGKDWFTKYTLARVLRLRAQEVQRWVDEGLLKHRILETEGLTRQVIDADDFSVFCKEHRQLILGRRIDVERLDFIQHYVFPPSHSELLPVRESKKERAAFETLHANNSSEHQDDADEEASLTA